MNNIYVTKTFLPPREEFDQYVDQIWASGQLTNQGPLVRRLQTEIENKLAVKNLQAVTNGTIAIQLAFRSLGITEGEVITTPFSYVASTSAILWEHLTPVFVDIDSDTLCIDAEKIEAAITPQTKAILAVHVFGYPCEVEKIESIAQRHDLKVVYDAAHAFGVTYKGNSLFNYGDATTCSFHATKLFHTIEGGCVLVRDDAVAGKLDLIKRFGHHGDDHVRLGINGKMSEFSAAMGLSVLPHLEEIVSSRKASSELYDLLIDGKLTRPVSQGPLVYNYAYYPVIFESEQQLVEAEKRLNDENIFPRRYFFPSLNTLPYLDSTQPCPVSESISRRIMCLPLYVGISEQDISRIVEIISP